MDANTVDEVARNWSEVAKNGAQALALLCAFVYFCYKSATGWSIPSLQLQIDTRRVPTMDSSLDMLAVDVKLARGGQGTLSLQDSKVRLTRIDEKDKSKVTCTDVSLFSAERYQPRADGDRLRLNLTGAIQSAPLNLAPGDSCQLAAHSLVAHDRAYEVEAVIIALPWQRAWARVAPRPNPSLCSQWSASTISLPISRQPDSHTGLPG